MLSIKDKESIQGYLSKRLIDEYLTESQKKEYKNKMGCAEYVIPSEKLVEYEGAKQKYFEKVFVMLNDNEIIISEKNIEIIDKEKNKKTIEDFLKEANVNIVNLGG